MKICIVTPYIIKGDGQGRVNYEIVKEAICRGYQITLVTRKLAPELEQHPLVTWVKFDVEKYPTALVKEMLFSSQSGAWLRKHSKQFDAIKVNGAVTTTASDVNAVHFVHSSWLRSPVGLAGKSFNIYNLYQWFYTKCNAYWEKQAFKRTKVVVAVSQRVANELTEIDVPHQSIRIIVSGVDLQEFFPGSTSREKLGLPENATLAIFAGDIRTSRKNLDTVLQALVKVPELHLAVIGTTDGSPYPQMATTLSLSDRVHFMGYRRDVAEIMRTGDLFVFPSRCEPFGLVVIEAMASGLPVITATTTGASDLVGHDCGIVVADPDNIEILAQALSQLESDPNLRTQMGKNARKIAEKYSWQVMAKTYIDLFEEVNSNKHNSNLLDREKVLSNR